MNFYCFKFLHYINRHQKVNYSELINHFKVSNKEVCEIINMLYNNGFVTKLGNECVQSNYKGKHYLQSSILSFINVNIIDVIALIFSIIAVIISIIALFN